MNWGVTIRRDRLGASLRWNHKPEQKEVVPINTRRISYTYLDVDFSFRLTPRMTLFGNAANITESPAGSYVYTANTPDYARRRQYNLYGVQCTFGLKGQF
ncbi:MAG: TonB-dependent receptor [Verrucomicrobia bacterium]|nr:TonB-dependent receptor [Verrucomicrobiota bacterium]